MEETNPKLPLLVHRYSPAMCESYPDTLFVFGDNLERKGTGGQAIIRDCDNAFGIPTKRLPSMEGNAFFSDQDDEFAAVDKALDALELRAKTHAIVWPADGIGSGRAQLNQRSPKIAQHLEREIARRFGVTLPISRA